MTEVWPSAARLPTTLAGVKKLGKVLGFVAGAAAVIWAMRDRLVSITAPREPEPPKFRVVTAPSTPPAPPPAPAPSNDDLTEVVGVGPVFAERLRAAGIASFAELATASPARIAEIVGVPVTRVADWPDQARALHS